MYKNRANAWKTPQNYIEQKNIIAGLPIPTFDFHIKTIICSSY